MMIANFQVEDKISRPRFFQKIFLVTNTKFEVILGMLFLKFSNADILFDKETLTWKIYIINKALLTTEQVQIVNPKEFVIVALDAESKTFVLHVTIWEQEKMAINPARKVQIEAQIKAQSGTQSGAQSRV